VAVAALQTGVDPVGACVGQRGTRIQGIVNELNGEKIDVIEWSEDPAQYITKSLGPAKVLAVHPSADTRNPKSATVVVPDDQLSLAIGREGQNARLAAKLTGWHIDIKSGSEALSEAMVRLAEDDKAQQWVGADVVQAVPALRELLVRQRVLPAALSPEEFLLAKRALDSVFDYLAASQPTAESEEGARNAEMTRQRREAHAAALASIPRAAFTLPIERLELSTRVMQHLASSGILSVGQLMERRVGGDEGLLSIEGIGAKALSEVKAALDRLLEIAQPAGVETIPAAQAGPAAVEPATDEVAEPATAIAPPELPEMPEPALAGAVLEVTAASEAAAPEAAAPEAAAPEAAAPEAAAPEAAASEAAAPEAVSALAEGALAAQPGEAIQAVAAEGEVQDERSPEQIFLDAMAEEEGEAGDAGAKPAKDGKKKEKKKAGVRDRVLIYDEELGRTIVQRSRKPGRAGEFLDEIEEG
jgi:N utilization substance protein A